MMIRNNRVRLLVLFCVAFVVISSIIFIAESDLDYSSFIHPEISCNEKPANAGSLGDAAYHKGCYFYELQDYWTYFLEYKDVEYSLSSEFNPKELDSVSSNGKFNEEFFDAKDIHFSYDQNNIDDNIKASSINLKFLLTHFFKLPESVLEQACYVEENCTFESVKTCETLEEDEFIVKFELVEENISEINFDNNCISITGNGEGILMASSFFAFEMLGLN